MNHNNKISYKLTENNNLEWLSKHAKRSMITVQWCNTDREDKNGTVL